MSLVAASELYALRDSLNVARSQVQSHIERHVRKQATALALEIEDSVQRLLAQPYLSARGTPAFPLRSIATTKMLVKVVVHRDAHFPLEPCGQRSSTCR